MEKNCLLNVMFEISRFWVDSDSIPILIHWAHEHCLFSRAMDKYQILQILESTSDFGFYNFAAK